MSFPRYPKYKDSGVEWLGEVPEHWTVIALRRCLLEHRQGYYSEAAYVDSGVKLLRITDLRDFGRVDFAECPQVAERTELTPFLLKPADFVFARTGGAGTFGLVETIIDPVAYASYLIRFRFAANTHPGFLRHFFLSSGFQEAVRQNIHGGVNQNIHAEDIKNQYLALPPLPEQTHIAVFLDWETAKIDELVGEQRRLMELLKEKRQAVISNAVTQGLNPHTPMKPSGIEWLGDVPEHWIHSRIKYNLRGLIDTEHKTAPFYDDGEYLVVRTTNIKDGKLLLDGAKYTNAAGYEEWTRRGKPKPGDIMFTREAPAGEACLVPEDVQLCMGQRTVLMQIDHHVLDSSFALWSLYGGLASEFITILSQGSTVVHFNMSDISNIPIMLPSVSEQKEIAEFLASETAKLDALTAEAQRAIDLLQERRTALISAAVTGQIDVRNLSEKQAA